MALGVAVWLAAGALATAQSNDSRLPLTISLFRAGFPTGPQNPEMTQGSVSMTLFKEGCWIPVYVDVTCNRAYSTPATLVIEAPDYDEEQSRYTVPIPQMQPGTTETVIGYARPGSISTNDISVHIEMAGSRAFDTKAQGYFRGLGQERFMILGLGSKLEGTQLPGVNFREISDAEENRSPVSNPRSVVAALTNSGHLPPVWLGYHGADVVFLSLHNAEFTQKLADDRAGRKAAIVEWVRRGGDLVVGVGSNSNLVAALDEIKEILPVTISGMAEIDLPRLSWRDGPTTEEPLGRVSVAAMTPRADRAVDTLMATGEKPLIVRGGFGLGRVTVIAFDWDAKPLAQWKSKKPFWDEFMRRAAHRIPETEPSQHYRYGYQQSGEATLQDGFIRESEDFPGVPVISFGWVALLILLYIIIVGPLDYWFLKKVVKRLEFTWITFPTIVLLVSVAAYYAAYALKGSDLRINKYDLVDIDVASGTMHGRTWFSLFSPRIQNYRVSIEPGSPDWTSADAPNVTTNWFGRGGTTRRSMFGRPYDYSTRAGSMDGVPIPVWSTRGFEAEWLGSLSQKNPLVVSNLKQTPQRGGLFGSVTVNLPVPLENAFLIMPGGKEVLPLGTIVPNTPKSVTAQSPRPFAKWAADPIQLSQLAVDRTEEQVPASPGWLPAMMLFHDAANTGGTPTNAGMRDLDQSWRLSANHADEAVLVGTLARREGASEEVSTNPASPSRLWIGEIPESGKPRPKLEGKLRQDTCVRIILPVAVQP